MANRMRLAHCSDLHLLSHEGARWLDLANKRWIGAMNLVSNRSRHYHVEAFDDMVSDLNAHGVEHVLCTGDVTNLALRQEFAFARELPGATFHWIAGAGHSPHSERNASAEATRAGASFLRAIKAE